MELNNYKIERLSKYNHRIKYLKNNKHNENYRNSQSAVFFDRYGVLIKDSHYISNPDKIELLPGVKEILKSSYQAGWLNIVVTNQSGISRGYLNWEDYESVSIHLINILGEEYPIHAIYANSNLPQNINSERSWRKPSPFMILEAAQEFNIKLNSSILIGDRLTDLLAAKNSGIKKIFHVLTGHGLNERERILENHAFHKEIELINLKNLSEFPLNYFLKNK